MISVKDEGSGLVSFANHSHFCGEIPLGSLNAGKCYSGWNIVFVVLKKREAPHIIFEAFKAFISKANKFELPKKKKKPWELNVFIVPVGFMIPLEGFYYKCFLIKLKQNHNPQCALVVSGFSFTLKLEQE